ncbi:S-adenosyl-L-methionine-dependent methyltransferase [Coniochaeta sp. PMI_546]|nr:S-adenosyl-L-methionine-dependent methyltransferase [Coniochaeta sp. PMI_546]
MASREETFRAFTEKQGANYAQHRRDYHPDLYQIIIDYHTSTGGQFDTLLDVGCGPGTATRSLAPHFTNAIGIDPSEGMVTAARTLGGVTASSNPVRFEVSTAEDLGSQLSPPVQDGSVDLITAATAAHWFDMPAFWKRAAQVLKPGGSVALWTSASMSVSPSTPKAAEIQAAIHNLAKTVEEYIVLGNRLSHELYAGLPLPWTLASPVPEFDEASFVRKEWGTGPGSEPGDRFYSYQQPATLDMLEKMLGTTSPIARWREAHPEVANTEQDVVRIMRREIEDLFRQAGVEQGKELIQGGVSGVLLLVKRRA